MPEGYFIMSLFSIFIENCGMGRQSRLLPSSRNRRIEHRGLTSACQLVRQTANRPSDLDGDFKKSKENVVTLKHSELEPISAFLRQMADLQQFVDSAA